MPILLCLRYRQLSSHEHSAIFCVLMHTLYSHPTYSYSVRKRDPLASSRHSIYSYVCSAAGGAREHDGTNAQTCRSIRLRGLRLEVHGAASRGVREWRLLPARRRHIGPRRFFWRPLVRHEASVLLVYWLEPQIKTNKLYSLQSTCSTLMGDI